MGKNLCAKIHAKNEGPCDTNSTHTQWRDAVLPTTCERRARMAQQYTVGDGSCFKRDNFSTQRLDLKTETLEPTIGDELGRASGLTHTAIDTVVRRAREPTPTARTRAQPRNQDLTHACKHACEHTHTHTRHSIRHTRVPCTFECNSRP